MRKELSEEMWYIWSRSFHNAKRFFESKGSDKTQDKLKTKWHNEFMKDLESMMIEVLEEQTQKTKNTSEVKQ